MKNSKEKITVETIINKPIETVWKSWTLPQNIINWSFASDDWHSPEAENDLQNGEKFRTKMSAKDESVSFDFEGEYTEIVNHKTIKYTISDGRNVSVSFEDLQEKTKVTETFEAENIHSLELQKDGWQAILDNFKKYTETL